MTSYVTVRETCALLKVSRQTVYEWMRSGRLKAVKAGRLVRIRVEDLESFLKAWRSAAKSKSRDTAKGPSVPRKR